MDLTRGSVFRNLIQFAWPYLLACFLQTFYGVADLLIAGLYNGATVTSAISIGSQLMHMITVMLVGLAMGVTVGIGRAVGAHDERGAGAVIGNAVTLFLAVSVVLAAVLTALVQPILSIISTPAEAVLPFIGEVDLILVMTVEPGFGGQSFMYEQLPKIRKIREYIDAHAPGCELEVDGGINAETAKLCVNAGANVLVAGSSVFNKTDRKAAIEALR